MDRTKPSLQWATFIGEGLSAPITKARQGPSFVEYINGTPDSHGSTLGDQSQRGLQGREADCEIGQIAAAELDVPLRLIGSGEGKQWVREWLMRESSR